MSDDQRWRRYRRRGEVRAEQRTERWTWSTATGERMQASPGDWLVIDKDGSQRSVAAGVFESTHELIGPGRYRRCGVVSARRVTAEEVVTTLEGPAVAHSGDWVLRGEAGEEWPVSDRHFRQNYEGPVDEGR